MSDNNPTPSQDGAANYQSTEDMVAAQAAHEADALSRVQAELATLQAKSAELADQYLRAKAEAENARRRAEDEIAKARKFAVEGFAESLLPVADSLEAGLIIKDATPEQIREGAHMLDLCVDYVGRGAFRQRLVGHPDGSTAAHSFALSSSEACTSHAGAGEDSRRIFLPVRVSTWAMTSRTLTERPAARLKVPVRRRSITACKARLKSV